MQCTKSTKTCVGEGEERERALDDVFGIWVTVRSCYEKRIETKLSKSPQNSPNVAKVLEKKTGQVVEKNLSTSFCVCLVSWKQQNTIRANIPKSFLRPVVSLLYATKSCRENRPLLLRTRFENLCQACAFASLPHFWQVVTWCKLHLARSRLRLRPQEIWERD